MYFFAGIINKFWRLLQIYKRSVWRKKSWTIANIFLLVSKCSWSFPNRSVLIFLSFSSSLLSFISNTIIKETM